MTITVTCGAVKAGKSKRLIEYYNQLEASGAMVFSSKYSLTNGESVVSRYGTQIKAVPIHNLFRIPAHIGNKPIHHILVDEFQFLQMTKEELREFFRQYYYEYDFYLFGLNMDYRRKPFPLMAEVLAMADKINVIGGFCDICGKIPSKYSLRLENNKPAPLYDDGQIILLDGEYGDTKVEYQAICDDCWQKLYPVE